jgi:serine/threonine protein kinase
MQSSKPKQTDLNPPPQRDVPSGEYRMAPSHSDTITRAYEMCSGPMSRRSPSQVVLGRYSIFDRIGFGDTASVHAAVQSGPGGFSRVVAIKRLYPHIAVSCDSVAMALDEARLLATVRHANVPQLIDVVEDGCSVALVMECIVGLSLSELMLRLEGRNETMPVSIVLAVVRGVLRGLHAAHEASAPGGAKLELVHRDANPQNILLGIDGNARIADFGVAKAAGRLQQTQEGILRGKVAYMSPEQIKASPLDRRSDVFTIGIVLWELLTGCRLFQESYDIASVHAVLKRQVAAPVEHCIASRGLNEVALKALERDPSRRFRTCDEFADALERAMSVSSPKEVATWMMMSSVGPTLRERIARVRALEAFAGDEPVGGGYVRDFTPLGSSGSGASTPAFDHRRESPEQVSESYAGSHAKTLAFSANLGTGIPSREDVPRANVASLRRPKIRKVTSSIDSAITALRTPPDASMPEIRRLYADGQITEALAMAKAFGGSPVLSPSTVLVRTAGAERCGNHSLGAEGLFVLSLVDGLSSVAELAERSGLQQSSAMQMLEKLVELGALAAAGAPLDEDVTEVRPTP